MQENICSVLSHPLVGKQFPEVSMQAYYENDIKEISIASYKGKWLIGIFYPADFTFVCPTELEEMANYYTTFKEEGAEVFSVSTDTAFAHAAWHNQSPTIQKIQFPMCADPTGELCRTLGTYMSKEGLSFRATFIIDPDGIIKVYEIHDNAIGRSAAEILRKLQAAKFVREHPGMVCPAHWQPGDTAMKTGINLVGKI